VHNRRQADERSRNMVIHTAITWGWRDPCLTTTRREYIAKAACRQVSYDMGYPVPLAHTRLASWYGSINAAITGGENNDPLSPSRSGRARYVDIIEEEHPGYLRELYRYAESTLGATATWQEFVEIINLKSAAPGEERPTLSISRKQLARWFQKNGGKEVSVVERPLLTREHKERRVQWVRRWYDILSDPLAAVAFLDEKWFYTSNQRRKVKKLPTDVTEVGPIHAYRKPRVQSRRFRTKVMFMGVVACPQPGYNFDGRVYLSRVSRTKRLARSSRNKRFSVDVDVVNAIVSGVWKRQLVTDGMTVEHLLEELKTYYDLDEYVSDRLVNMFLTGW